MRQKQLSYWLKAIVIILAVLGAAYIGGVVYISKISDSIAPGNIVLGLNIFSYWTILFIYVILIFFWNVCTQIGRGNSFSLENAATFHKMTLCSGLIILGFVAEFVWAVIKDYLTLPSVAFICFKTVLFLAFAVLCEALSKLILHAYEIRKENDLTI